MQRAYAKMASQFWTGETGKIIRGLGLECRVIAAYAISGPDANAIGLYLLPLPTLSHYTGIASKGALKALRSLSEAGFSLYDPPSEWIFVRQMARFQIAEQLKPNDNRIKWIKRELEFARKSPFFNDFLQIYRERFHLHGISPSEGPLVTPRSQDPDPDLEQDRPIGASTRAKKSDLQVWFYQEFVTRYPRNEQQAAALALIKKIKPNADARSSILAHLELWKASEGWRKDGGQYVPGMRKFFADGYHDRKPAEVAPLRNGNHVRPDISLPPEVDELFGAQQ